MIDQVKEELKKIEQLFETSEIAKFTKEQVRSYEDSLKYYRDLKNSLDTAKEEGREEGIKEGREEGIKEGKEEGQKETKIQIAKEMLESGETIEKIMRYTGLSKKQIENL